MVAEQIAYLSVKAALIGVQAAFTIDIVGHDLGNRHLVGVCNMEGTNVTATLN